MKEQREPSSESIHNDSFLSSQNNVQSSALATTYNDDLISSFKTAKILPFHLSPINNISTSEDGNLYLTSGNDNKIYIYSITKSETIKQLTNQTYGCEKAIFTHNTNAILCASKTDYRIMYWCVHNNEVLFCFLGHSNIINEIIMNPINDLFITTSADGTSRLWDLNLKHCICIIQDSQCACFDNEGSILLSVTMSLFNKEKEIFENFINLYYIEEDKSNINNNSDINSNNKNDNETINDYKINEKPLDVFSIKLNAVIKQIRVTKDGKYIICITENNLVIVNKSEGKIIHNIEVNDDINRFDISPDSKYIALCCSSGNVIMFNIDGNLIKTFEFHTKNCECINFNPRYAMLATADTSLVFWILNDGNEEDKNKNMDNGDTDNKNEDEIQ